MTVREAAVSAPGPRIGRVPVPSARSRNLELLRELVRRDLQARYRGSRLGLAWSLLNPLLFMVIYTVVFSTIMRFRIADPHHPGRDFPYAVYLLSGLLAWNFFSNGLVASVNSVLGNASLVKKVAFPWVLLTLAAVLAAFINYLISLVLLVPFLIFFKVEVGVPMLMLPLIAALTLSLVVGLGLVVAAANVYFRDIEYLLLIGLQVMFFLTPIIYQLDDIVNRAGRSNKLLAVPFKWILYANPMTWLTTSFQDVIAFGRLPSHPAGLLYGSLLSLAVLALGAIVFNRLAVRFAEEL